MAGVKLFLGTVRSRKTGGLIHAVKTQRKYGQRNILVIKPTTDKKSEQGFIVARDQDGEFHKLEAIEVSPENPWAILEILVEEEKKLGKKFDGVAIDEGQFFKNLFLLVGTLLRHGYDVLVAGLDLDFRGEPFGDMLNLTALAIHGGQVTWCDAFCTRCGALAKYSQRIADGKPAHYDNELYVVGNDYEPRCENCFELPGRPYPI